MAPGTAAQEAGRRQGGSSIRKACLLEKPPPARYAAMVETSTADRSGGFVQAIKILRRELALAWPRLL